MQITKRMLFGLLIIGLLFLSFTASFKEIKPFLAQTVSIAATTGNWWDTLGEPEYGGTISYRVTNLLPVFDTYTFNPGGIYPWIENIYAPDWALDRDTYSFNTQHVPLKYIKCQLLERWEQPDPKTLILRVNKDIHWHNKAPMNGRALEAHDLEYYYHRMLGMGSGYDRPLPMYTALRELVESVTVIDDSTITLKFTKPGMGTLFNFVQIGPSTRVEPAEALEAAGGSIKDWHDTVGTGAWMISNFIGESSATYTKNPDYYDYDERFPQNRLPYADELKLLCIPDKATAIAALRTGKLDIMDSVDLDLAMNVKKSDPELKQMIIPDSGMGMNMRVDRAPFDDIRVRKALQMSINRKEIAEGYYRGTVDDKPAGHILPAHKVFNYPYSKWPQKLKDEYTYNPEKAKQFLSEAGYPNGFKTTMLAAVNTDLQLAQIVKAYLKDIGVDVTIDVKDVPTMISIGNSRKQEAMVFGAVTSNSSISMTAHHYYGKESNLNLSAVNDPEYDALFEKFANAADEAEALSAMRESDKLGLEKHWQISIFPINSYTIYQPYLKGYSGEVLNGFPLGAFYFNRIWIDQGLKKTMR